MTSQQEKKCLKIIGVETFLRAEKYSKSSNETKTHVQGKSPGSNILRSSKMFPRSNNKTKTHELGISTGSIEMFYVIN